MNKARASGLDPEAGHVSDERDSIDDFRDLNVTVTRVGFQRGGESGNWSEHDVTDRTVDLIELQGENATVRVNRQGERVSNATGS